MSRKSDGPFMPSTVSKQIKKLKIQLDYHYGCFNSAFYSQTKKYAMYSKYLNCSRRLATLYYGLGEYDDAYELIKIAILHKYGDELILPENPERMAVLNELLFYAQQSKDESKIEYALLKSYWWANAKHHVAEARMAARACIQLMQMYVARKALVNASICGETFINGKHCLKLESGGLKCQLMDTLGDVYSRRQQWIKAKLCYQQALRMSNSLSSFNASARLQIMLKSTFIFSMCDELTEALFICVMLYAQRLDYIDHEMALKFIQQDFSQQEQGLAKELLTLMKRCNIPQMKWLEVIAESIIDSDEGERFVNNSDNGYLMKK